MTCAQGHRHWGRYGAAGLLLRTGLDPTSVVLLQLRAGWSHHGSTWGLPGGARDADETVLACALREAQEELGLDPTVVRPEAVAVVDHGGWSYTTVIASSRAAPAQVSVHAESPETDDVRWVAADAVEDLPLHPGLADLWPTVRDVPPAPILVVDAANVIGSRPDGWWKDRAGAVRRLRDALSTGARTGLALGADPELSVIARTFPEVVLVTEGVARGVEPVSGVEVVPAPGSGDDTIVVEAAARAGGGRNVLVVTADRELRRRVEALGATVLGPRTLWQALD